MKRLSACAVALAAIGAAAPAAAQSGARWVDPQGRMMILGFLGGGGPAPAPLDRASAEMAGLFKALCLDTGGDPARIATAATAAGLTSQIADQGSTKTGPMTLSVWQGSGLALSQTSGWPIIPNPQCNATFHVSALPTMPEVMSALSAAIGASPSNLADATDKKGRARKYFSPEWTLDSPAGSRIVTAIISKHSRSFPGNGVLISIRASNKAGK